MWYYSVSLVTLDTIKVRVLDHVKSWTTGMSLTELYNALNCNSDFPRITKNELRIVLVDMEVSDLIRQASNSRRWFERRGPNGRF